MSRLAYPPRQTLPASGVTDAPLAAVIVNRAWLGVLLSACERLSTRWGWIDGTDYERAEQQALTLYLRIANAEGMIGTVHPYVTTAPPTGCLPCDGSVYSRIDYPLLYDRLPAWLIVDGNTFRTPDLRGRFVMGSGAGSAPGDVGGMSEVTLTVDQMPSHSHTSAPHTHQFDYPSVGIDVEAPGVPDVTAVGNPPFPLQTTPTAVTIDATGGGQPHENLPPFLALAWCIVAV